LRIEDCFDAVIPIEHMTLFGHLRPKPDRRLFRYLPVLMRVAPRRCVLVEDTLEHQKAARAEGWRTVWMQRWMKAHPGATAAVSRDLHLRAPQGSKLGGPVTEWIAQVHAADHRPSPP
jgi:putative hydrolase of the HAD superfamily